MTTTLTTPPAPVNPHVVKLTKMVADVYAFILGLEPSGKLEFELDNLYGRVSEGLGIDPPGYPIKFLKDKGLVIPLETIGTGFAHRKLFKILRRPYEVSMMTSGPKKTAPKPAKFAPESDDHDSLEGHLKFFSKHRELLDEADRRRKSLAKKGFEMIDVRGRLAFLPKK